MTSRFNDFKNFLKLLSLEEQLREIDFMINGFKKTNNQGEVIAKKVSHVK